MLGTVLGRTELNFPNAHICGSTGTRRSQSENHVQAAFIVPLPSFGFTSITCVILLIGSTTSTYSDVAVACRSTSDASLQNVLPVATGNSASWLTAISVSAGATIIAATTSLTLSDAVPLIPAGTEIHAGVSFKGEVNVQPGDLKTALENMFGADAPTDFPVATLIPYSSFFPTERRQTGATLATTMETFLTIPATEMFKANVPVFVKDVVFSAESIWELRNLGMKATLAVSKPGGESNERLSFTVEGQLDRSTSGIWQATISGDLIDTWQHPFNATWLSIDGIKVETSFSASSSAGTL